MLPLTRGPTRGTPSMLQETPPKPALPSWIVWTAVAAYTGLRLVMLPADGVNVKAFGHDGAYLSTLANNLQSGRGYVNDALWLVFLMPEGLPMPFHNANPLYP